MLVRAEHELAEDGAGLRRAEAIGDILFDPPRVTTDGDCDED